MDPRPSTERTGVRARRDMRATCRPRLVAWELRAATDMKLARVVLTSLLLAGCGASPTEASSDEANISVVDLESCNAWGGGPGTRLPSLVRDVEMRSHYQRVNGVCLHWAEAGTKRQQAGSTIVLLHGIPEYSVAWRHQIAPLVAAGYHVVAIDTRGSGASEMRAFSAAELTIPTLAKDVATLIEANGFVSPMVVGHDIGGLVAWQLAASHHDKLSKVMVIDGHHPGHWRDLLYATAGTKQYAKSWYVFSFVRYPELMKTGFEVIGIDNYVQNAMRLDPDSGTRALKEEDVRLYSAQIDGNREHGSVENILRTYSALFEPSQSHAISRDPRRQQEVVGELARGAAFRYFGEHPASIPGMGLLLEKLPFGPMWTQLLENGGAAAGKVMEAVDAVKEPFSDRRVKADVGFEMPLARVPVRLIGGERDAYLDTSAFARPEEFRKYMAPNVPVTGEVWPGMSHWIVEEAPQQVTQAILSYARE
jgi:pimeloyl-ACP methyl ester carboxylesterase